MKCYVKKHRLQPASITGLDPLGDPLMIRHGVVVPWCLLTNHLSTPSGTTEQQVSGDHHVNHCC